MAGTLVVAVLFLVTSEGLGRSPEFLTADFAKRVTKAAAK
jgi:hypothetical protein